MLKELEKQFAQKERQEKERLERESIELKKSIAEDSKSAKATLNKERQNFDEYVGVKNKEIRKREASCIDNEKELRSIEKERSLLNLELAELKAEAKKVTKKKKDIKVLEITLLNQIEEANKKEELYETRLAEIK